MSFAANVSAAYSRLWTDGPPTRLGIALSGGSDSTALLILTREALPEIQLFAATVDHQLREGSGKEAEQAGQLCHSLGLPHEILPWEGWAGEGNLQAAARSARSALLADWAERNELAHVALGHTRDDQAETVLMRLARGSGVDGLAAMAPLRRSAGISWLRPMLEVSRQDLRAELTARGVAWADDPSNDDLRFDRVKARAMTKELSRLGLTPERLVRTASQMAMARDALNHGAAAYLGRASVEQGDLLMPSPASLSAPRETVLRAFAHALCWVSSTVYRPRFESLTAMLDGLEQGKAGTLHGCRISSEGATWRITREYAAVADVATPPAALWDKRWQFHGPKPPDGAHVAALGAIGLAECENWRDSGLPRASLLASPALWLGDRLLSAPLAGRPEGWAARLCHGAEHLVSTLRAD
ncbi:tRNA lysidine(34) synthetase TilS [Oceanicola sp. D3]|uniref:tRNA lysidine(34) synthetase TilS n=1 Tax=Oceanicola sp. D3 TaxID=2587163 RepID=UPI0011200D87|nr:tRNA lysidine(34) synthetase TilS [Oceanicola sp. D3]QDC08889.1 tRNA lysidine(34) synthetase TilS [Oceanicola sp. D3]